MPQLKAFNIAIIALCAALYAVVGYLTSFGFSFGGVAFWPAAFVPAIFAVVFGPWEGGIGAVIGIFIRDNIVTGQPLLSLTAGVTANFAAFFLIGYISQTKLSRTKTVLALIVGSIVVLVGLLLPTILLPTETAGFTTFSTTLTLILFSVTMGISLMLFAVITRYWPEFNIFGIGAIIGQCIGALIVSIGVWGYSQFFFSPTGYFKSPVPTTFVPIIFVWTVVTEIPFVLLVSPPIIKVCYLAFPFLKERREKRQKAYQ
jgi:uncharacterized membrane protein